MPGQLSNGASAGAILELVRSGRVRTRRELQDRTGLSRSTLSLRMNQLAAAGYIQEIGQVSGSAGRPAKILSFDESGHFVLAVDLGAAHAHLALLDAGGTVLMEATHDIRIQSSPDEVIRSVGRRLGELLARSGKPRERVAGIGVGVPGPVFPLTGRPNQPPMMPGWHDYPIGDRLAELLGLPVFVDNDANLMGLGEARQQHPDAPSLLFVKLGTGIGAGVILHGAAERGIAGGAGDIGHIRMAVDNGVLCTCGATGCLATVASGGALARQLSERGVPAAGSHDVARLLAARDPLALELARVAGRALGDVLATSVALLNPAVLVLGGELVAGDGGTILDSVRESIHERTVPIARRELIITVSRLGADAAVQGARHLVIDRTFAADAVDARLGESASA